MVSPSKISVLLFTLILLASTSCSSLLEAKSQKSSLSIDLSYQDSSKTLMPQMLGVNSRWLDSGGTIIQNGETVRDRSFRNHEKAGSRWLISPNKETGGTVKYSKKGGDTKPWGGLGYPGFMSISQKKPGYTCISQQILGGVKPGEKFELHLSGKAEKEKAGLSIFLADGGFLPIEAVDNLSWVEGDWTDYMFVLEPSKFVDQALLRICLVTPGSLAVDEIRMAVQGKAPEMRPIVKKRIKQLGIKSLRWPTGSDADYFNWKTSVGNVQYRVENKSAFGDPQTPTWGLHEFLDFTEAENIIPLLIINIRLSPNSAADLVEYVLGSSKTPMGQLRKENGRNLPWKVTHFELGNEPVDAYKDTFSEDDTSKGYVKLSKNIAKAMRIRANKLGETIYLKGILETTFADATWIKAVPMLSSWNSNVLNIEKGLLTEIDNIKGNFYSAFMWDSSEKELFEEVMAGGTTLTGSVARLNKENGGLPPFWLTEYGIMVQKTHPTKILLERAKDYQAGLAIADVLLSSINAGFEGAYAFNLAEEGTWGMLANNTDYRLRPSGLAFSMISKLVNTRLLPVGINNAVNISISGGKGNNPKGMKYSSLVAIAGVVKGKLQLVILNRSYDIDTELTINLKGNSLSKAVIHQLGPYSPTAGNDEKANKVVIKKRVSKLASSNMQQLMVPARSLLRIVYQ
jgi:alpha-L-arabinofuranosidase